MLADRDIPQTGPQTGLVMAAGLMSGTSRDGIDAALIATDGAGAIRPLGFTSRAYDASTRSMIAAACDIAMSLPHRQAHPAIQRCEDHITALHADILADLFAASGVAPAEVAAVGFHGHTVAHRADRGWTWQIGNGQMLADRFGIDTIVDMRLADMAAGGQGAPLLPIYHQAIFSGPGQDIAVLNLGGVANLTWLGRTGDIAAFDCGMASALIDDWMAEVCGKPFDEDGALAATGRVDAAILAGMLDHPYFTQPLPKSLDRADFGIDPVRRLSPPDGAATLTAFSAQAVAMGLDLLPGRAERIIVAGGGRKNRTMMAMIAERCGLPAIPAEDLGWDGDAIEAQGFAYMAVRHMRGYPTTFPGTTGVSKATVGGRMVRPARGAATMAMA